MLLCFQKKMVSPEEPTLRNRQNQAVIRYHGKVLRHSRGLFDEQMVCWAVWRNGMWAWIWTRLGLENWPLLKWTTSIWFAFCDVLWHVNWFCVVLNWVHVAPMGRNVLRLRWFFRYVLVFLFNVVLVLLVHLLVCTHPQSLWFQILPSCTISKFPQWQQPNTWVVVLQCFLSWLTDPALNKAADVRSGDPKASSQGEELDCSHYRSNPVPV